MFGDSRSVKIIDINPILFTK